MTTQSYRLVMRSGPTPDKVFVLTKENVSVGRSTSNDIAINDSEVSRNHARIYLQSGGYVIEDLNSTNGTYINGQRLIGPHLLRPGETINLGENISLIVDLLYDEDVTLTSKPTVPVVGEPARTVETPPGYQPVPPTSPALTPEISQPGAPYFTPAVSQPKMEEPIIESPSYAPQSYQDEYTDTLFDEEPFEENGSVINWNWVFAGCGCMTVVVCILIIAALFWIDAGGEARWCQYLGFLFPSCP